MLLKDVTDKEARDEAQHQKHIHILTDAGIMLADDKSKSGEVPSLSKTARFMLKGEHVSAMIRHAVRHKYIMDLCCSVDHLTSLAVSDKSREAVVVTLAFHITTRPSNFPAYNATRPYDAIRIPYLQTSSLLPTTLAAYWAAVRSIWIDDTVMSHNAETMAWAAGLRTGEPPYELPAELLLRRNIALRVAEALAVVAQRHLILCCGTGTECDTPNQKFTPFFMYTKVWKVMEYWANAEQYVIKALMPACGAACQSLRTRLLYSAWVSIAQATSIWDAHVRTYCKPGILQDVQHDTIRFDITNGDRDTTTSMTEGTKATSASVASAIKEAEEDLRARIALGIAEVPLSWSSASDDVSRALTSDTRTIVASRAMEIGTSPEAGSICPATLLLPIPPLARAAPLNVTKTKEFWETATPGELSVSANAHLLITELRTPSAIQELLWFSARLIRNGLIGSFATSHAACESRDTATHVHNMLQSCSPGEAWGDTVTGTFQTSASAAQKRTIYESEVDYISPYAHPPKAAAYLLDYTTRKFTSEACITMRKETVGMSSSDLDQALGAFNRLKANLHGLVVPDDEAMKLVFKSGEGEGGS
jgi:hypothetical protein